MRPVDLLDAGALSANATQTPPSRVLVLGGTGLIGSEIARAFVTAGSTVTVVARREPVGAVRANLAGACLVTGDASDPLVLAPLLDRADHVVHAVGSMLPKESTASPALDLTTTLPAILSLLDLLRVRPALGLTYISSGGTVYGNPARIPIDERAICDPITSYGIVKLAAEKYIGMYARLYGVPAHILRVANVYGPLQPGDRSQGIIGTFLAALRDRRPVSIFGDGGMTRDYVHVSDVAYAAVELSRRSQASLVANVGTGIGHTILEVLAVASESWAPSRWSRCCRIVASTSEPLFSMSERSRACAPGSP